MLDNSLHIKTCYFETRLCYRGTDVFSCQVTIVQRSVPFLFSLREYSPWHCLWVLSWYHPRHSAESEIINIICISPSTELPHWRFTFSVQNFIWVVVVFFENMYQSPYYLPFTTVHRHKRNCFLFLQLHIFHSVSSYIDPILRKLPNPFSRYM